MWRVLSLNNISFNNHKDTPLSSFVHPQLSVIPHWAYEKEYRFFIKLEECVNIEGNYFLHFGTDLLLRSVILGPEHPYKNRNNYRTLAAYLGGLVKSFGADILVTRAERKRYRIVRSGRWTPRFEELMEKL